MRMTGMISFFIACSLLTACYVEDKMVAGSIGGDYYPGTEKSSGFTPNGFVRTAKDSLSTFGLDVDKAAYTFHRRKVMQENMLPSPEAVRTEEFLNYLVDAMRSGDRISIATYAGEVSTVLEPTALAQKDKAGIKGIIHALSPGGGTAMADGLKNAYAVNRKGFLEGGVNRVIVCSDGDANIGATGWEDMLAQVKSYKEQGITMSTLGFGIGNYSDANMEMLADRGNGNYYYIDSEAEAERLFTEELTAMMQVVAWDAKIQVAFRREAVKSYRLLGYENRDIADSAFHDDTTDAGEIGAGHTVTAPYELVLADPSAPLGAVHLRYRDASGAAHSLTRDLGSYSGAGFSAASADFRFAFTVAEYAEILRQSRYSDTRMEDISAMLRGLDKGGDPKRAEFAGIVDKAARLRMVRPKVASR
jgi:Ca-activated chloride channel family protein